MSKVRAEDATAARPGPTVRAIRNLEEVFNMFMQIFREMLQCKMFLPILSGEHLCSRFGATVRQARLRITANERRNGG
jgi:hypothetical protein